MTAILSGVDDAISIALADSLPDVLHADDPMDTVMFGAFLRPHLRGLHPHLSRVGLTGVIDIDEVLGAEANVLRRFRNGRYSQTLASLRGCLVMLRAGDGSGDVWVSGVSESLVADVGTEIKSRVPRPDKPTGIRTNFWHSERRRSRDIDVPTWSDVADNYPARVRGAMAELNAYRPDESLSGGKLIIWHGPPGTGKTTAVRSLFHSWREWTRPHVVADGEQLLSNGEYMASVLLDFSERQTWRLVVLEDAEEFLRRDASVRAGAGLGRLLNMADGLLGQGSKVVILMTTNEPIADMHPAILRPGRCLARIEFPAFTAAEASYRLGRSVSEEMTLAELMQDRGRLGRISSVEPAAAVGQYL